jgi:NADP-dependent 3-hydroxy acid dehydrogenase YdfG
MSSPLPIALITGASSGIGAATARQLAVAGYRLILCGRRANRLQALAAELDVPSQICVFDVADYQAAESALTALPADWQEIDLLVNNAGNAHGLEPIHQGLLSDWDAMLDSNVRGLLYLTRLISPGMVAKQRGHIVNIGSIAGRQAYGNGAVYCATKTAVAMLSDGMRIDLNPYGIKVTTIEPGLVETEFSQVRFKGDIERAENVYKGLTPLNADDVAETIVWCATRPPHVVIGDILLLPLAQASATVVKRN